MPRSKLSDRLYYAQLDQEAGESFLIVLRSPSSKHVVYRTRLKARSAEAAQKEADRILRSFSQGRAKEERYYTNRKGQTFRGWSTWYGRGRV